MNKIQERYIAGIDTNRARIHGNLSNPLKPSSEKTNFGKIAELENDITEFKNNNKINKAFPLNSWQTSANKRILRKHDVIVSVPPAAGKTEPVIRAWFGTYHQDILRNVLLPQETSGSYGNIPNELSGHFFRHNDLKDPTNTSFPRLAYIVPTKGLATQIFASDVRTNFFKLIDVYDLGKFDRAAKNNNFSIINIENLFQNFASLQTVTYDENSLKANYYQYGFKFKTFLKPIVIGTYSPMAQVLDKYGKYFHTVIIDEFQEVLPHPGIDYKKIRDMTEKDRSAIEQKYKAYDNILKKVKPPGKCGIALLTGSTYIPILREITTMFNSKYARNFELIAKGGIKEEAANRSNLVLLPTNNLGSQEGRIKIIKNKINYKESGNLMIIFSVKLNTKFGVFRLATDLLPELNPRKPESLYGGIKQKNLMYSDKKEQKLSTHKQFKQYIKQQQGDFIDPRTPILDRREIDLPILGDNVFVKDLTINEIDFLKYFDLKKAQNKSMSNDPESVLSELPNENNLLYQSILRGYGFITGGMHDNHKITVQKLFRMGKIYFLLATNAIGVGANIKVKEIYVPQFMQFSGEKMEKTDPSSIIQILNRAGRGAFDNAYLYVPTDDFDLTKKLIDRNINQGSLTELNIKPIPLKEFKEIFGTNKTFKEAWKTIMA